MGAAEWLYKIFMSQACVYESQIQYRKSNEILTNVVQRLYSDNAINQQLKEAIEKYQVKITGKQQYFAFYCRKTIPMSFDAMTTSPVESVNNHIKHNAGVCCVFIELCVFRLILIIQIVYIQIDCVRLYSNSIYSNSLFPIFR